MSDEQSVAAITEFFKDRDLGTPSWMFVSSLVEESEGRPPSMDTLIYLCDLDETVKRASLAQLQSHGVIEHIDNKWRATPLGEEAFKAFIRFGALNSVKVH